MPFKKVGNDDYTSPSGRHFNSAQVRLYYANGSKFPSHAEGGSVMAFPLTPDGKKVIPSKPAPSGGEQPTQAFAKGGSVKACSYAKGGSVLGRSRNFLKESDGHDQRVQGTDISYVNPDKADSTYTKKGATPAPAKPTGNKSLTAVKPRK